MHKKFRLVLTTLFVVVAAFATIDSFATSPPPPGGGDPDPPCWPPPCTIPIDGGISFLIAVGAAYGGKKLLEKRTSFD